MHVDAQGPPLLEQPGAAALGTCRRQEACSLERLVPRGHPLGPQTPLKMNESPPTQWHEAHSLPLSGLRTLVSQLRGKLSQEKKFADIHGLTSVSPKFMATQNLRM